MIIFEFYILSTGKLKTLRRVYGNVLNSGKDVEARGGSSVQLGLSSGRLEAHIHTFAPHSLLPGARSQFSKTSEKSSPTTSPYPPLSAFLLAFEYSSDGVQKDVQKFGSQRSRALLKETKFGGGERWRGFLWLCAVLFLTVWRIVFISVCLQSLSVNIFALLIWNSPALSGFHLAEPPSPTCFLIH